MSGYPALRAKYCCIMGVWPGAARGSGTGEGASSFIDRHCSDCSVQLHLRVGLAADHAREGVERHAPEAVQRPDVLAVEGDVEELRHPAFDAELAAGKESHQLPDGLVVAEGDQ